MPKIIFCQHNINEKGSTRYFLIIVVILSVVVLSQAGNVKGKINNTVVSGAIGKCKQFIEKGSDWAMSNIYPKVSGEMAKRGVKIKEEIKQEKENISENYFEKIKNYFTDLAERIVSPTTTQNKSENLTCEPNNSFNQAVSHY